MKELAHVVLLHGHGRGPWALSLLASRLRNAGFITHNLRYSARAPTLEPIILALQRELEDRHVFATGVVHFVTHSLGGLVVRAYLSRFSPSNLGRVVMLAPPNAGTEIVDHLKTWRLFSLVLGPLAVQLGTGVDDLPANLPELPCQVGVLAGSRSLNPLANLFLPKPHDGTVSVARTHLDGETDHLSVPYTHPLLMNSQKVAHQVVFFLQHGTFERV